MAGALVLDRINCQLGDQLVVTDLSLDLQAGELACLLGPSGCGKTTALRAIAGLQDLQAGSIAIDGRQVASASHSLAAERRKVGLVFQDFALFPHLNLSDNVAFGIRGLSREQRHQRVAQLLSDVGLEGFQSRWPHQLSGGQQQRAALARSLAAEPQLLLLDEPFSSLDTHLRTQLREDLRRLLKKVGMTAVLVTHDQDEAFGFADWIGVMNRGHLEQWARPFDIYHRPANAFVASFIGGGRLLKAQVRSRDCIDSGLGSLRGPLPDWAITGARLRLLLRPDDVTHDANGTLSATVAGWAFRGAETLYTLQLDNGDSIQAMFPSHLRFSAGEQVPIALDLEHFIVFPEQEVLIQAEQAAGYQQPVGLGRS